MAILPLPFLAPVGQQSPSRPGRVLEDVGGEGGGLRYIVYDILLLCKRIKHMEI